MLSRQEYIKALGDVLTVKEDFKSLNYVEIHNKDMSKQYLQLELITGHVIVFDVTGYSDEKIYHSLAMVECGTMPANYVRDTKELILIGKALNKKRTV